MLKFQQGQVMVTDVDIEKLNNYLAKPNMKHSKKIEYDEIFQDVYNVFSENARWLCAKLQLLFMEHFKAEQQKEFYKFVNEIIEIKKKTNQSFNEIVNTKIYGL